MEQWISLHFDPLGVFSLIWFFVCWVGYARYAKYRARNSRCIASLLHGFRVEWMQRFMRRDNRISDTSLLASLERNVTFLASTSMLMIAGLLTVLSSSFESFEVLQELPIAAEISPATLKMKLLMMVCIYIYAFFTFTWTMRQYGFCTVMLGAAPMVSDESVSEADRDNYANYAAKLIDQAGHSYNYGLRAFYFSVAVLAWFLNPYLFILATSLVVGVLYHREFHSKPLDALQQIRDDEWRMSDRSKS